MHKELHGGLFTQQIWTHDIKKLCRLLASYMSEECSTSIHLGVTYLNYETVSMPAHTQSHIKAWAEVGNVSHADNLASVKQSEKKRPGTSTTGLIFPVWHMRLPADKNTQGCLQDSDSATDFVTNAHPRRTGRAKTHQCTSAPCSPRPQLARNSVIHTGNKPQCSCTAGGENEAVNIDCLGTEILSCHVFLLSYMSTMWRFRHYAIIRNASLDFRRIDIDFVRKNNNTSRLSVCINITLY